MKTKVSLLLIAFALVTFAVVGAPAEAAKKCNAPACFASPGCCVAAECASWCASTTGGTPGCSGGGEGGCCYCLPPES
jgi:hypothetical protein